MDAPAISAAMVAQSRAVAEPRWSPDGRHLAWVEATAGRADLVVCPADCSEPPMVVSADAAVRPVGGYGGGAFTWAGSQQLVVAAADGRLVLLAADGSEVRTLLDEGRCAAPACPPGGDRVAFVLEHDADCAVAVLDLDRPGAPVRLSDSDYAWDPAWSPDGRVVAWHEWDLPAMPWDGSRIVTADPAGHARRPVAGGAGEAVGQPRFSPDGRRLAYVSDRSGWWNVWVGAPDGTGATPVHAELYEQAEPTWGPGQRSFAWSPDGDALALTRNENGFGRLLVARAGETVERGRGWHHGLDWGPAGLLAVRSGARTPSVVTLLDDSDRRRVLARGPVGGFEAAGLVEPDAVTWAADDGTRLHGLLWRPAGVANPPLLVDVHGGPTGQSTVTWRPWPQFFVARGWAVLAPNGRGSTGYGREYAQALAGRWGDRDVADVAAGIRHATAAGWCDPHRVALSGGSAGALTVLLLCAQHGPLVRAAVSMYGVSDLLALAETTHRFESRYLDRLVGPLPADTARYEARSPITHAAAIRVPVLVLHGDADRVVPLAQAERLIRAVRGAGGTVEARVYAGEGHGWARPDTIADAYERTSSFLRRWVLER